MVEGKLPVNKPVFHLTFSFAPLKTHENFPKEAFLAFLPSGLLLISTPKTREV